LDERVYEAFCVADSSRSARPPDVVAEEIESFFGTYFPVAAPWERQART
jgi:hypothetical protein